MSKYPGVVLLLVDTSGSMNQRTSGTAGGLSYLDIVKQALETFVTKTRRGKQDRYLLVTYGERYSAVKIGWSNNPAAVLHEIKSLRATDLTQPSQALQTALELLNLYRLPSKLDFDNYGRGWTPWSAQLASVISISDGGRDDAAKSVDIRPAHDLCKSAFHWDQRIFSITLKIPGHRGPYPPPSQPGGILSSFSDETGGQALHANSTKALQQALEAISPKLNNGGLLVSFEPIPRKDVGGDDEAQASAQAAAARRQLPVSRRTTLFRPAGQLRGNWPIPESFWPNKVEVLPPRPSHPTIHFSQEEMDPQVVEGVPFDKYELAPSALTQAILSLKRTNICFQCFVENSHFQDGYGCAFGYLKPSSSGTSVNLVVMPYDYPSLIPLLVALPRGVMPSRSWTQQFERYLANIPNYYFAPMKAALAARSPNMTLFPEHLASEGNLKYSHSTQINKAKAGAVAAIDRTMNAISQAQAAANAALGAEDASGKRADGEADTRSGALVAPPTPRDSDSAQAAMVDDDDVVDLGLGRSSFADHGPEQTLKMREAAAKASQLYRNPFDVERKDLLSQLAKMRANFFRRGHSKALENEDVRHSMPIAIMGDYLSPSHQRQMLRPAVEPEPQSPLRLRKRMMKIDEAEDDDSASSRSASPASTGGASKRSRRTANGPGGHANGGGSGPDGSALHSHQRDSDDDAMASSVPGARADAGANNGRAPTPPVTGGASFGPPSSSSSSSTGAATTAVAPSPDTSLASARAACMKELRQPSVSSVTIISLLQGVKTGPYNLRLLVQSLLDDARRMRKEEIAKDLEQFLKNIAQG